MLGPEHLLIWDQAALARAWNRPILLARGFAGVPSSEATGWPVGERDAYLLAVHRAGFGDRLALLASCPACKEPASFDVSITALLTQTTAQAWPLTISHNGMELTCHRPSTTDLAQAWSNDAALPEARRRLCRACIVAHRADGKPIAVDDLDEPAIERASAVLSEADPLSDIRFALTCPACEKAWEALFDPPHMLWRALDAWARTSLNDVRELARAYGWSESEILAMHPSRRQFYLDAVS
jgi:hypothetical protein